jgi:enamine deaminase RidA (YjgF/YER057c/UK114 family)
MTLIPSPQGLYRAATRHGNLIWTAGMTPRKGDALLFQGPIKANDDPDIHREAVELAISNALTAAKSCLKAEEKLACVVSMTVFIAAQPEFEAHARIADHASRMIEDALGSGGIGTRAAVGVASLPSGAPVEISLVASVEDDISA